MLVRRPAPPGIRPFLEINGQYRLFFVPFCEMQCSLFIFPLMNPSRSILGRRHRSRARPRSPLRLILFYSSPFLKVDRKQRPRVARNSAQINRSLYMEDRFLYILRKVFDETSGWIVHSLSLRAVCSQESSQTMGPMWLGFEFDKKKT